MSIEWGAGALMGCFGTFGTSIDGSQTTIDTEAAGGLANVGTSRSL